MHLNLETLIGKLNPTCRKALESAAQLCASQTNYNVEIEHLLLKLTELQNTDIPAILQQYAIRIADLTRELTRAMDGLKRGNSRTPAFSQQIITLLEQAWITTSLSLNQDRVRSGALFQALLDTESLRGMILESCPCLRKIPRKSLLKELSELAGTAEDGRFDTTDETRRRTGYDEAAPADDSALNQFTTDLTEQAQNKAIDPVQCREVEIRQIIDILTRRRQNNPILTGEAGVGKTAVVEGFALRIAQKDVPPSLQNVSLRMLDLGLLQAGAGIKGEFEKRLKSVIDEVKQSKQPIILFIDEAHTLIGAGGSAGMGDAANLLKPALARGELRTIAATTWSEYKKYFEKDTALARRFQVIKVAEPDEPMAVTMLWGIVPNLEAHHGITILGEAVRDAVRLSHRYIADRKLPDKAISVLDTACARVAVAQNTTPPVLEDAIRQIEHLELELAVLQRELDVGLDHEERRLELVGQLEAAKEARQGFEERWDREKNLVQQVLDLEKTLTQKTDPPEILKEKNQELSHLQKELGAIQGEEPMVPAYADSRVIASVVSGWTGIPLGKMLTDEINTVLHLQDKMEAMIIGQSQALSSICRRIQTYRADLDDPGKPVGVFLLAGPSGVGKTETAIALADVLYGGERNMVQINMSEYQEAYTVSGLKGSPPGYVGHGRGGVLTEAVRRNPFSIVLLDEVEKAHPDVMELFYQVFDKGMMEDAEGVSVDFKNTVIFLTSNVGADEITAHCAKQTDRPDSESILKRIRPIFLNHFKPAFLGRLVIIPYYPLQDSDIRKIAMIKLRAIQKRMRINHRVKVVYKPEVLHMIAEKCRHSDTGARNVDYLLTQQLLPKLSEEILTRMASGEPCAVIRVYLDGQGEFVYDSANLAPDSDASPKKKASRSARNLNGF